KQVSLSALGVIAQAGAADPDYYNLTAGVFAGIVPARALLALPFLRGTAKSTVTALGTAAFDAAGVTDPRREAAVATMSMLRDSVAHPIGTIQWGVDCGLSAFEFATQLMCSATGHVLNARHRM